MKNILLIFFVFLFFASSNAQKSFGFTFTEDENQIKIIRVYKNSPSEKAGILVGDVILAINNSSTTSLKMDEVMKLLSESKDDCTLTVKRNNTDTKDVIVVKQDKTTFLNVCLSGNCQNGDGVFIDLNCYEYKGTFQNSKLTGFGQLDCAGASIYTGNFLNGVREGKGKEVYRDGSYYEGNYVNGLYHGQGVFTAKNGDAYSGIYNNGKIDNEITHYIKSSNETFIKTYKNGILASSIKIEKELNSNKVGDAKENDLDNYYKTKKEEIATIEKSVEGKKLYKERLELYQEILSKHKDFLKYLTNAVNENELTEKAKVKFRAIILKEKAAEIQIENLIKVTSESTKYDK